MLVQLAGRRPPHPDHWEDALTELPSVVSDPDGEYPPNTLLVVSRLVSPDFLVEIEAVAKARAGPAP